MMLSMALGCVISWTDQAELGLTLGCILRHLTYMPASAALWGQQSSVVLALVPSCIVVCSTPAAWGSWWALFLRLDGAECMSRLRAAGRPAMSSWLGMFLVRACFLQLHCQQGSAGRAGAPSERWRG